MTAIQDPSPPPETNGFPPGYFMIKNAGSGRVLDVALDSIEDGSNVILFTQTETSLVESRRNPNSNNQVFFVDTSGALCSRSSGHAIDVEDERLVLRHRRPVSEPYPNQYSHPLPNFSFHKDTAEIIVKYACDPSYPSTEQTSSETWRNTKYVLTSMPRRKPKTFVDDATQFLTNTWSSSVSLFSGQGVTQSTPEDVASSGVDLKEDEVLQEEWGEEAEVDDSLDPHRDARVVAVRETGLEDLNEKAQKRRQWVIESLRVSDKRTAA
ncbi:hypothetical protein CYLTODRAFT_365541 [Cylindrobasidium torrendii FP15055 ss-10]|uniref:Ricin B lectin domain-containing protein n=1 Tax=Cylindrobasidium torrendii FP15055 ss-10 TaxID=1314674 RepID=A0A0D7BSX0_9AGAR|nr:hypothetical protein CYLTODRAFT_365541 [Cylindrobasidium torrendii FP15055 ss-10]